MIAGLSLIVAVQMLNQIPNTAVEPYLILLSGALAGSVEGISGRQRARDGDAKERSPLSPNGSHPVVSRGSYLARARPTPPRARS